jgi:hypothetical protein
MGQTTDQLLAWFFAELPLLRDRISATYLRIEQGADWAGEREGDLVDLGFAFGSGLSQAGHCLFQHGDQLF